MKLFRLLHNFIPRTRKLCLSRIFKITVVIWQPGPLSCPSFVSSCNSNENHFSILFYKLEKMWHNFLGQGQKLCRVWHSFIECLGNLLRMGHMTWYKIRSHATQFCFWLRSNFRDIIAFYRMGNNYTGRASDLLTKTTLKSNSCFFGC